MDMTLMFKATKFFLIKICFIFLISCSFSHFSHALDFENLKSKIRKDYNSITHMSQKEFLEGRSDKTDILIFDVREKVEFNISHIPGAKRIDPSIWTSTFIKEFGKQAKNKKIVFYCSVGVRSSKLAERVKKQLMSLGAKSVVNLDGGIFDWHNSKLDLVNQSGKTDFVHSYSKYWGQLIKRSNLIRN